MSTLIFNSSSLNRDTMSQTKEENLQDGEFYFDDDAPEFVELFHIFVRWMICTKKTGWSNNTDGEMVEKQFRQFVEVEHVDLARKVARDADIYAAILRKLETDNEIDLDNKDTK